MKSNDRADEQRLRILRAAEYIVEHIEQTLTAAQVAKVAAMSEFHFQRVFAAVMDETVGAFTARRRMELAALMLAYHPHRSIGDIASSVGASSSANFAKAFGAYFGCRPSDVRKPGTASNRRLGKLVSRYGKDFSPSDLYALPEPTLQVERSRRKREIEAGLRYEERDALKLACLRSPAGYDYEVLQATWDELIDRARQLGLCGDAVDAYGIGHDSPRITAPELCRYDACVPWDGVIPLPPPLFAATLPAGRYAVFRYAGPVAGVERRMRDIYSVWFPSSSLVPDDRFTSTDHYVNDAPVDGQVDMEILFKVRPRK